MTTAASVPVDELRSWAGALLLDAPTLDEFDRYLMAVLGMVR